MKMLMMHFFLGPDAGKQYAQDYLGHGSKWDSADITDKDGNKRSVSVKFTAGGQPVSGIDIATKQPLTSAELAQAVGAGAHAGGEKKAKPDISLQTYEKTMPDGSTLKGRLVSEIKNGHSTTVFESGGTSYDLKNIKPESIATAAAKEEAKQGIQLKYTGPIAYTKSGADFAGKFNAENGTNIGYQTEQPGSPLIDKNTGMVITPDSTGNITATKNTAGTVTTTAPGAQAAAADTTPLDKLPKAPKFKEPGFEGESPAAFGERTKAWSTTYGKQYEQVAKNTKAASDMLPYINQMKTLIDKSTSSGIGSIVDAAGGWVGYSTDGAKAIAAIAPLAQRILMGVQRFEGPQSDKDVATYKEAAGRLADPTVPSAQKQAAFATIVEIMKRNAPGLNWDSVSGPQNEIRNKADEIINKGKKK
jgi:hypothetical protein